LRLAIADLAGLDDEDIREILAALTQQERSKVEALLAACAGEDAIETTSPAAEPAPEIDLTGLSPWLVQRLAPAKGHAAARLPLAKRLAELVKGSPAPSPPAITPVALEALTASAASVQGHRAPARKAASPRPWNRWLVGLGSQEARA
jgi:hypothetical protein